VKGKEEEGREGGKKEIENENAETAYFINYKKS
jgi:hypothetical protein